MKIHCGILGDDTLQIGREVAILNIIVVYVFLLLSMYSYCSSTYSYRCLRILIVVPVFSDAATLIEVFLCFFLGCKANDGV